MSSAEWAIIYKKMAKSDAKATIMGDYIY